MSLKKRVVTMLFMIPRQLKQKKNKSDKNASNLSKIHWLSLSILSWEFFQVPLSYTVSTNFGRVEKLTPEILATQRINRQNFQVIRNESLLSLRMNSQRHIRHTKLRIGNELTLSPLYKLQHPQCAKKWMLTRNSLSQMSKSRERKAIIREDILPCLKRLAN